MKKKGTQTVENTTEDELKPTEDELKLTAAAKKVKRWRRSARNGPPEG